ncbi:MAG: Clp protease ClpP [Alistipes sp.]|nr:Clp protease ClpP [Alistipes sp.]
MQNIRIRNRADETLIEIDGIIGPAETPFDEEGSSYRRFRDDLERIRSVDAQAVRVEIRSTGGDVNDALLIYEALRSLNARITTCCYGYTASAATLIAQAASEGCRQISASALYLIHNSICAVEGNAAEIESGLELLRKTDERIADLYASRSGRPAAEFAALMSENNGNGRWLSPQQTVEEGLADEIVGNDTSTRSIAGAIARTFNSLLGRRTMLPAADRNIFRLGQPDTAAEPAAPLPLSFGEGQRSAGPTDVLPAEDPSLSEPVLSPNARAYADDLKRLIKK